MKETQRLLNLRMFRRKKQNNLALPSGPIEFPNGIAVVVGNQTYFIKNHKCYSFVSLRARDSWNLKTFTTSVEALANYPLANTYIGFRDGTLLRSVESLDSLWIISDNRRRRIVSPDILTALNLSVNHAILVGNNELLIHTQGEDIG